MSTGTTQPPPTAGAPPPGTPVPGWMPQEPPRKRWWLAWHVLLAAVGIVVISGGATAAVALNEVGRLTEALEQNKPVKVARRVLAPTSRGEPETLLLVGNDERAHTTTEPVLPHSNEMLLVRIDPSEPTISMLSIPRELKVPIDKPNGEVEENRINAAFTYGSENGGGTAGGVRLMLETIKQVLGLTVNQVFVTNFHKFAKAVNAMGCVYMTVDKRYYHHNEPGGEQYFEINLQPGYQKLCGTEALEFVANRHESTSLIRDARDQRFLLEVKAQYGASLFEEREKFEDIFGRYVESTLHSEEEILQLLYLLVEAAGKPVRQVPFNVTLLPTFDTATPQDIQEAASSFLNGTASVATHALASHPQPSHARHHSAATGLGFALTPTSAEELQEARAHAPDLPFPLEYPRARDSFASAEPDELRLYHIRAADRRVYPIYDIVIDRGELGQYYDVQGTTWSDPPILSDPGQTVQLGSRTYELFYEGEHVRAIAWREHGAVYWVENTLTNDVSPRAMLAVAEQTLPVITTRHMRVVPAPTLPPANINLAPRSAAAASTTTKVGAVLAFVLLGALLLLAVILIARQRELRTLRDQVARALALETSPLPVFAAAALSHGVAAPAAAAPLAFHDPPPTVYRARRSWRRLTLATLSVLATCALLAAGGYLLVSDVFSPSTAAGSSHALTQPGARAATHHASRRTPAQRP